MSMLPEYETNTMTIGDFLKFDDYWWTNKSDFICVNFRVVNEMGIHKYVSVGKHVPRTFDIYMDTYPGRYVKLDGLGGLMGELMDLSVLFNIYKIAVLRKAFNFYEYTVWLTRLEDGQEHNIDADLVEKFSRKVCG